MKFTLAFLSAMAVAAAVPDDMVLVQQETHYTFQVDAKTAPVESDDTDDMINECLASSFNNMHDPSEYQVQSIELESETVTPTARQTGLEQSYCTFQLESSDLEPSCP